jgi:predicted ATPase
MAFAGTFAGFVLQGRGEVAAARATTEGVIALSTEQGLTDWLAWATSLHGWAMADSGRDKDGIAQMCEGLAASQATGALLLRPYFLTLLAEAYNETGSLDEALSALSDALEAADEHEIRNYEAETHRLKGELLLRQNQSNAPEAQRCFERAIEVARKQNAKSLELRATMSLARLLKEQGRRDEAHAILAEIYGWFTEGFDTADLKDAKALLDELGA